MRIETKMKIGIIGHGFVGKAVEYGFTHPANEFMLIDPKLGTSIDDLVEWQPNLVFVCTPTPMRSSGKVDSTITEDAVLKVMYHTQAGVALKSTCTPDVIERILMSIDTEEDKRYLNRFCYNPEFLTEANAFDQFTSQPYIIVGGESQACQALLSLYEDYSNVTVGGVFQCSAIEASIIKYSINSFLALKTTFFNELYDLCDDAGVFYSKAMKGMMMDGRVGYSHMKVPGHDGRRGFGGACFPKDTKALTVYSDRMTLLESAIEINNKYRSDYDLNERELQQNVTYGQAKEE